MTQNPDTEYHWQKWSIWSFWEHFSAPEQHMAPPRLRKLETEGFSQKQLRVLWPMLEDMLQDPVREEQSPIQWQTNKEMNAKSEVKIQRS